MVSKNHLYCYKSENFPVDSKNMIKKSEEETIYQFKLSNQGFCMLQQKYWIASQSAINEDSGGNSKMTVININCGGGGGDPPGGRFPRGDLGVGRSNLRGFLQIHFLKIF